MVRAVVWVGAVGAADYPTKRLTYIICFNPGGESDITARFQEQPLKKVLGVDIAIVIGAGVVAVPLGGTVVTGAGVVAVAVLTEHVRPHVVRWMRCDGRGSPAWNLSRPRTKTAALCLAEYSIPPPTRVPGLPCGFRSTHVGGFAVASAVLTFTVLGERTIRGLRSTRFSVRRITETSPWVKIGS